MSSTLKYSELLTMDYESCLEEYSEHEFKNFVHENTVCTTSPADVGTCMGDSGMILIIILLNFVFDSLKIQEKIQKNDLKRKQYVFLK